jgi:hypothetical protein
VCKQHRFLCLLVNGSLTCSSPSSPTQKGRKSTCFFFWSVIRKRPGFFFFFSPHLFVCEEEAAWSRTEWPHAHGPAAAEEALVVADCGGGGRRVEDREFVRAHQFALQRRHLRVSEGRKAL